MLPSRLQRVAQSLRERLAGGQLPPGELAERSSFAERARTAVRHASPAAELALLDRGALRAWWRFVRPIGATLGVEAELGYTALVLRATRVEARLGRLLALSVPDHLARVHAGGQLRYLEVLEQVLEQRPTAVGMVARTLPELMERLGSGALREFVGQALALHGGNERIAESFLKRESDQGRKEVERLELGLPLSEVSRTLTLYARAHCGEDVQIRPLPPPRPGELGARNAWSDGHHIYMPARMDRYGDERDFLVYRVMTARTAGYLEMGTFDLELDRVDGQWPERREGESDLERFFRAFPNRVIARDLFRIAEDARVERAVIAEYPGIGRDIAVLRPDELAVRPALDGLAPAEQLVEALFLASAGVEPAGLPPKVREAFERARALLLPATDAAARVEDVVSAVARVFPIAWELLVKAEEGQAPTSQGGGKRGPREEGEEQRYGGLEDPLSGSAARPEALGEADRAADEAARELREAMQQEGIAATLSEIRRAMADRERGRNEASYEEMAAFLDRNPTAEGGFVEDSVVETPEPLNIVAGLPLDPDADPSAAAFLYWEWDAAISDYKPDWVRVREHRLQPGDRAFTDRVLEEQGGAIRALRRRFEALRPQGMRRVKGQLDGDELDVDRLIEARVALRAGGSPPDRLYNRHLRDQRDVAVAFLLDMSSSTNELAGNGIKPILQVEKEALVMIAEALDAIGDACGIYGFSGYSREHVAFYVAKDFADPYDDRVRERIGRMRWKMENRDGAAIRHATRKLRAQPARTRLLMILSDGRPLDCGCDQYHDQYAQEDTRAALREARMAGVHPFCITVDPRGEAYLESLFGEVGYIVIERAEALPERLPRIYWRLTR